MNDSEVPEPSAQTDRIGHCMQPRVRYVRAKEVIELAERRYRENGRGITFADLLQAGLASNKAKAQYKLQHLRKNGALFTLERCSPQRHYPSTLRSEILKSKVKGGKSALIGHRGVAPRRWCPSRDCDASTSNNNDDDDGLDPKTLEMLCGSILRMLPSLPVHIHKMNFRTRVPPECYAQLDLRVDNTVNKEKAWSDVVANYHTRYRIAPNGTVMVYTSSSKRPLRIQTESDLYELVAFVGQVRDRLVLKLMDIHERIIEPVTCWYITQCDINKDVPVSEDFLNLSLDVRFPYLAKTFHIYIKGMGSQTVCRVEQELNTGGGKTFAELLDERFDPVDAAVGKILAAMEQKKQEQENNAVWKLKQNSEKLPEVPDLRQLSLLSLPLFF